MTKPPRVLAKARKTDVVAERAAGRLIFAKPADLRQAGFFDLSLPNRIKPCPPDARQ